MDERERKMIAFLAGMVWRLANGEYPNFNEMRQLDNIMSELGYQDLDENEFRY